MQKQTCPCPECPKAGDQFACGQCGCEIFVYKDCACQDADCVSFACCGAAMSKIAKRAQAGPLDLGPRMKAFCKANDVSPDQITKWLTALINASPFLATCVNWVLHIFEPAVPVK